MGGIIKLCQYERHFSWGPVVINQFPLVFQVWFSLGLNTLHHTHGLDDKFDNWRGVLHALDHGDVRGFERIESINCGLKGRDGFSQVILTIVSDGLGCRRRLVSQGLVTCHDLLLSLDLDKISYCMIRYTD